MKGHGLGYLLIQMIIEYARAEGLKAIEGQVLTKTPRCSPCAESSASISRLIRAIPTLTS